MPEIRNTRNMSDALSEKLLDSGFRFVGKTTLLDIDYDDAEKLLSEEGLSSLLKKSKDITIENGLCYGVMRVEGSQIFIETSFKNVSGICKTEDSIDINDLIQDNSHTISFKHLSDLPDDVNDPNELKFSLGNYDNVHLFATVKAGSLVVELYNGWENLIKKYEHNIGVPMNPALASNIEFKVEGEYLHISPLGYTSYDSFSIKDERGDIGLVVDVCTKNGEVISKGYLTEEDIIGEEAYDKKYGLDDGIPSTLDDSDCISPSRLGMSG
jgi:hypothetical protein